MIVFDVFRWTTDLADSISLIHTVAAIGRLAHGDTSLLKFLHQILNFPKSSQEFVSPPLVLAPPLEHYNLLWLSGSLQDTQQLLNP